MKVLMLTPYLPYPPASGGQIRTYYLLKYLHKDHQITLVSLYKNSEEKQYSKELERFCKEIYLCKRAEKPWKIKNIVRAVISPSPFLVVRNFSKEAKWTIERLLQEQEFDVIHAETFYIMPHIPDTKIPVILVEQTIEYKVYQHFISSLPFFIKYPLHLDILKLEYWETFYWKKATTVATVSQSDADIITKKTSGQVQPALIPNGAGDEMFVSKLPSPNLEKPKLLFVGNFSWLQNIEAAQKLVYEIFPSILKNFPKAELRIVGQNITDEFRNMKVDNVSVINLESSDNETVKKMYHSATVFLAPIFGPGGTRLKLLASMASGVPIVSTPTGVEGLGVVDGIHALLANSPKEFAQQTLKLLEDKNLYTKVQRSAFEKVRSEYSWKKIAKVLAQTYKTVHGEK